MNYIDIKEMGVYAIVNEVNNKMYIGSTINFIKRTKEHMTTLEENKHHNKHLQKAFNKYGSDNFKSIILEKTNDKNLLTTLEQKWMDFYKTYDINFGYNIRLKADSNLGLKYIDFNRIKGVSEDTKEKN